MNSDPPQKRAPKAIPRSDRTLHILELLTIRQPRSTDELAAILKLRPNAAGSSLSNMERQCLIRRAFKGRGRGEKLQEPPTLWALRCWTPPSP